VIALGRNAVAFGLLLLLRGPVGARLTGVLWVWTLVIAAVVLAVVQGVVGPGDTWMLARQAGLEDVGLLVVCWSLYSALAAAAGGPRLPGPAWLVAPLSGAMIGEVGAAAALGASALDRKAAARLALAAAAGGLIGRVGDPALLVLSARDANVLPWLLPLVPALLFIARPRRSDLPVGQGSWLVTAISAVIAIVAWVAPGLALPALALGAGGLLPLAGRRSKAAVAPILLALGTAIVVLLSTVAGGPELVATGLEMGAEQFGDWSAPALALGMAIVAALGDGVGGGLMGVAILDRTRDLQESGLLADPSGLWLPGAWRVTAIGAAAGGLMPLVAAGALRAGWWRWGLGVLVAVAWAAVVA
jgi:hypothetical protein